VKVIDEPFVITNPSVSVVLDHPYFQNGLLDIPIVDTPDQAGLFQDGLFQYDAQIDAWRLLKFNTHPVRQGLIQNVEIIITDTFPVQVFLKVSSPDIACNTPGRISKRFYDLSDFSATAVSSFNIIIDFIPPPPDAICAAVVVPYEKIVPLQVYGLPAGTYEYIVNGEHTGTFDLTNDNKL
jgi:hypothetical protein